MFAVGPQLLVKYISSIRIALRQCYPQAFLVSSTKLRILSHVYCGLHYLFKISSGGTVPFCLLLVEKCISFLTDAWFYYEAPWWLVNNPPAMKETWVRSLEWEDPLEKRNAKHSGILAWRIPWTAQSMGSQKSRTQLSSFHFHFAFYNEMRAKVIICSWRGFKAGIAKIGNDLFSRIPERKHVGESYNWPTRDINTSNK